MNEVKLRPAVIEDLPTLYHFEQGIITVERPWDPTLKEEHINYYDIKAMIESDQAEVMVATVNDLIVGSGYVKIKKSLPYLKFENHAYVGFMFVSPKYRGQGISDKIITALKSWAQARNLTELRLGVYDDNESAIRAYEKSGLKKHMIEMRMEI